MCQGWLSTSYLNVLWKNKPAPIMVGQTDKWLSRLLYLSLVVNVEQTELYTRSVVLVRHIICPFYN